MADFSAWVEKNKALWTRVYDEVIAPDFEEEWKKREKEHKEELKQKEEYQQTLFTRIGEEAVKNSDLVAEIGQLKEQLQKAVQNAPSMSSNHGVQDGALPVSTREHHQLNERFNELNRKYQDVYQKAKYLERKNNTVMQKNKDMKESVRAWQAYADRQSGKQKLKSETRGEDKHSKLPHIHHLPTDQLHVPSSPMSETSIRTPRSIADLDRSSPALLAPTERSCWSVSPIPNAHDGKSLSPTTTPKPTTVFGDGGHHHQDLDNGGQTLPLNDQSLNLNHEGCPDAPSHPVHPTSSQTTEDELAERQTQHLETSEAMNDGDFPQFVSTRSLKRKRAPSSKSAFEIYADRSSEGTPAQPYRIKEEQFSSPPPTVSKFMRTETFDLDDPMPNILQTPRRRKRMLSIHSNVTGTLRQQRSSSAPFSQLIKRENTVLEANISELQSGFEEPGTASMDPRANSEPSTQNAMAILQPLDPNILTTAAEELPNKQSKRTDFQHKSGGAMFATLGQVQQLMNEDKLRFPSPRTRAKQVQELWALNDTKQHRQILCQTPKPSAMKVKLEPISAPLPRSRRSPYTPMDGSRLRNPVSNARSSPQDELVHEDRQIWTMGAPKLRSSARKARRSSFDEQGRLRNKTVLELNLKDFKVNPAYNQGYSYAFSETVRKRGDRLCLPGCTNTQCCGSTFRVFAEAQAPLPASQEEVLLENYLGDAYNNMQLTQMSAEERAELVLQARTKKLANETGKHREAFERRKTPPGFWRVDFPTTQEQQEDREKAKVMERKEVQERWLEAQRKGGKWIFRDE